MHHFQSRTVLRRVQELPRLEAPAASRSPIRESNVLRQLSEQFSSSTFRAFDISTPSGEPISPIIIALTVPSSAISAGLSFYELELRTFYDDPGYCLGSGGSPTVSTVTISPNTDIGRRAETHLATITAASNFILFHASRSWGCVWTVDCCGRMSFFGSVLFSYFTFCFFNCSSACRCSVCRLAMTKWLFSP